MRIIVKEVIIFQYLCELCRRIYVIDFCQCADLGVTSSRVGKGFSRLVCEHDVIAKTETVANKSNNAFFIEDTSFHCIVSGKYLVVVCVEVVVKIVFEVGFKESVDEALKLRFEACEKLNCGS